MTDTFYIALAGVCIFVWRIALPVWVIEDLEATKAQQAETIIQQSTKITQLESDIAENQRITLSYPRLKAKREEQI